MVQQITSRDNEKIKYACKLGTSAAFRQSEQSFLAEGLKLCLELAKDCPVRQVFYTAKALEKCPEIPALGGQQYEITPPVAQKLAGVESSQGLFCVFGWPRQPQGLPAAGGRYLALEGVQDPGNVGALLRSAAAFGFERVLLGPGCASPFGPKTLRASMGAAGRIPLQFVEDLPGTLAGMRARGIDCYAAALYNSRPLDEVDGSHAGGVCLVIGSEGQGLSQEVIRSCTAAVRIPISNRVESLNAGVAGGVLLWHFRGKL